MDLFKEELNKIDVLLIDDGDVFLDLQFFKEELLHLFTWFVSQQKQLAVTSKVGLEGFLGLNFPDCGLVVKLEIGDSSANKDQEFPIDLWKQILAQLQKSLSKPSYESWFSCSSASFEGDTITIYAPNEFTADWLESRYDEEISKTLSEITGKTYNRKYVSTSDSSMLNSSYKEKKEEKQDTLELILEELKEIKLFLMSR